VEFRCDQLADLEAEIASSVSTIDNPVTRRELAIAAVIAAVCAILLQAPHLFFGRAHVNLDFTLHYNYAREYAAAIVGGDWWPRWAFNAQQGLGEPGPLYYAPLYYLLSGAVARLTGNVWIAMQMVEVLSTLVVGLSVYALARHYAPHRYALAAVPLAIFAPMLCLLHLGFNGYPWASAIAPLAVLQWALLRPGAEARLVNIPAILALAATVAMHTVTGLMVVVMTGSLGLYGLYKWYRGGLDPRALFAPVVTVALGLLLSAAYLYPAYTLQHLVDSGVWRRNYTPFDAFSLSTITAWRFGMRWFAFQWPISLILLSLSGVALWQLRAHLSARWCASAAIIVGVCAFLSLELSYPLWLIDTPLRNVQFPHRFMTILSPLAAVLVAVALARAGKQSWIGQGLLLLLSLGSVGMGGLVIAKAAVSDGRVIDTREQAFAPYNGLDEYRTGPSRAAGPKVPVFSWQDQCKAAGANCTDGTRIVKGMSWTVTVAQPVRLTLPIFQFPGWQVQINGAAVAAAADARTGLIAVDVSRGENRIAVKWVPLREERIGLIASLLASLILATAFAFQLWRKRRG
jgi:hypothetical protein